MAFSQQNNTHAIFQMASSQQNDTHAIFQAVSRHSHRVFCGSILEQSMQNFCTVAKEKFYLQFLWFSAVRIILLMLSTLISFSCHPLHTVSAIYVFLQGATVPGGSGTPYFRGFTIKLRHITLGTTSPDERSALPDSHRYPPLLRGIRTRNPNNRAAADPRLRVGTHL